MLKGVTFKEGGLYSARIWKKTLLEEYLQYISQYNQTLLVNKLKISVRRGRVI